MSSKTKTIHTCSFCGYQSAKWLGRCPDCDQWNTFYEEIRGKHPLSSTPSLTGTYSKPVAISNISLNENNRIRTGIDELDRVLGGGLVRGAVILVGGDPGIGKSTLVLQALTSIAHNSNTTVLYVSGEESLKQVRMRADRLGCLSDHLSVLTETSLEHIITSTAETDPVILAIDSVQTIHTSDIESAPGSVSQIRESTSRLIREAKSRDCALFLIGHVTKEGAIAGPRILEHMVDTVLYFEGDRSHSYRILRAVKNRFGSTDEIGVFEMHATGLNEVKSPSEIFISERPEQSAGSTIVTSMEGTRPILVEVQALTSPSALAMPRRTSIGVDQNRLSVLVAVLERKAGMSMYNQDVFLSIAGGIKLQEPGIDLGVVAAIISSRIDKTVPPDTALCGEVGLTGEIRAVTHILPRIREAERLGFSRCIVPASCLQKNMYHGTITLTGVQSIQETVDALFS